MKYYEHSLTAPLVGYIQSIWALESEGEDDVYQRSVIMPDGIVEVVFHYGEPFCTWRGGQEFVQPRAFAISMMEECFEIGSRGQAGFIAVRFFPWGAYHFFNEPIHNFADTTIEASMLWGEHAGQLAEALVHLQDIEQRFKAVETFMANMLQLHKKETERTDTIIKHIRETKGMLTIEEVCEAAGISKKQLERNFLSTVGTMPKVFSRIMRFLHICNNLEAYRGKSTTQLAYECGFADQSHFIKDFKRFSGFTPKEYFEKERVYFTEL